MKIPDRLERLREVRTLNWGELCDLLGIKRSMLHYLREGQRHPSPKLLRRIEELEVESQLEQPAGHMTGRKNKGETADFPVPIPGTPEADRIQALEARLAAVEDGIKEILKMLKGMKR